MEWSVLLCAIIIASTSAVLGSFLILSKQSLMADAISHAVLPGIVIAFLISSSRASIIALIGAAAVGLLVTASVNWLKNKANMPGDSAIGVSYTTLFAIGIILISQFANNVELDQECVLFGEIGYVPFDVIRLDNGTNIGPRALYVSTFLLVLIGTGIYFGYKNLSLLCFNKEFGISLGINMVFWNYYLLSLVSVTTVVSFEMVGAILIVALLIIPAASAYLLTKKLKQMISLAIVFAIASCVLGYLFAVVANVNIAGSIASTCFVLFLISFATSKAKGFWLA